VAVFFTVNAEDFCTSDVNSACKGLLGKYSDDLPNCSANFSGFSTNVHHIQAYANDQILKSYEYLLLAANFGSYVKNRPGFEKQFRALSDTAWNRGVGLMKHITKRGGAHDFAIRHNSTVQQTVKRILELNEINALAVALDTEKTLSSEAHGLHERYSHANHKTHYDAEIAHYFEEEFIEDQATTIRKLSGYTNDLKRLLTETTDSSLSLYMFDEYLQKQ